MSKENDLSSYQSISDTEEKIDKSKTLAKYNKSNFSFFDKKYRKVLHLGVLYKNLSKTKTNSIDLNKITQKIQTMIDKNQIYLRDVGPLILGISQIVVKKTFFLYKDIEELTNLRINSRAQNKMNSDSKSSKNNSDSKHTKQLENGTNEENTLIININPMETNEINYPYSNSDIKRSANTNNKISGYKKDILTFGKDIIEMTNDDMVRRTIQKLSKLENSDIK